jgi:DegV family protein with EDD domain
LEEIVATVEELKQRVQVRALLESLEHLRRGGRIGRAQELIGSLLDIRPIVGLEGGVLALYERVRSRRAGLRVLVEIVAAAGTLERVAVLHVGCPDEAMAVAEALTPAFPRDQMLVLPVGQVVAAHVGPRAVGVAYVVAP